jgi:hypothetical protein
MTESFTLGSLHAASGRCVAAKGDRGRFGHRAIRALRTVPDRIVRVVGIFSLSSHPVIIIIMVLTAWMAVLGRGRNGR